MTECIQSLWIGRKLSAMERLSISSFLANGHEYHLYVYGEMVNAPPGTVLKVADDILPESMIFQYKKHPSYAGFSNFFRYKLLLQKGGWWVDTDVVCLKPFDFEDPYVFASERVDGRTVPTTAVIKVPPGSEIMAFNWHLCRACPDPSDVVWGEHGPKLMAKAISKFGLQAFLKEADTFCPLAYNEWENLLLPGDLDAFSENSYGVHLWNEMWRRGGRDKDASYGPGCLYERLKQFSRRRLDDRLVVIYGHPNDSERRTGCFPD
jgi:Glycosyltransferase sugar-binding region containing DXD motif/Alpha 1,4-glycosyltransferase conserved region